MHLCFVSHYFSLANLSSFLKSFLFYICIFQFIFAKENSLSLKKFRQNKFHKKNVPIFVYVCGKCLNFAINNNSMSFLVVVVERCYMLYNLLFLTVHFSLTNSSVDCSIYVFFFFDNL